MNTDAKPRGRPRKVSSYSRGDGRWEARTTIEDPETGRPRRVSGYGPSEQDAHMDLSAKIERLGNGLQRGQEPTLEQWASQWLTDLEGAVRPATLVRYRQCLAWAVPSLAPEGKAPPGVDLSGVLLRRLSVTNVSGLLKAMRRAGRKSRTCNRTKDVLGNLLHEAERRGLIERNVARLARPLPETDKTEAGFLEPEQVPLFLTVCAAHRQGALWITAIATGKRLSELQGLRWEDVKLEDGVLNIRRELRRVERQWVIDDPKTAASKRKVGLPLVAVSALQQWRARQAAERLQAGDRWSQDPRWDDLVFTTPLTAPGPGRTAPPPGEPPQPTGISKAFRGATREAGLDLRFHDQRHSNASLLLYAGVDMRVVAEQLGHSDPGFTAKTYAHVARTLKRQATEAMDRVLGAAGG